ncbi:MAG TPA: flagellar motor switch protein FliG [Deltaproteobacteria bacterium]|nr:flagellar motor switch protein FliG [Deltaproteobacteria bacterium]
MPSPAKAPTPDPLALTGPQRAAILIMYLERPVAKEVLRHMNDEELEKIGEAMAEVESVQPQTIEDVVGDFLRDMYDACLVPRTGPEYALDVLPELVDSTRRIRLMSKLRRRLSNHLEVEVARHTPRTVAAVLLDEHPQTQAVALLLMGEDNAAMVLGQFPEGARNDVALRMARIERVPSQLADKVEESLINALEDHSGGGFDMPGVDRTAKILGRLSGDDQQAVLDGIAEGEPELSETLRRRMVVFDDLVRLDDRSMQTLLKSIERDKLVIALRGAADELLALVLKNMSSRAAQDLSEEIEVLGPKPKQVVEQAREEIVQTVLHLREEGAVILSFGDASEML